MKESAVKIEVNVYAIQVTKVQIAMSKSVHQLTATGTSSNHTGNVFIMGEAISAMVNANAILGGMVLPAKYRRPVTNLAARVTKTVAHNA